MINITPFIVCVALTVISVIVGVYFLYRYDKKKNHQHWEEGKQRRKKRYDEYLHKKYASSEGEEIREPEEYIYLPAIREYVRVPPGQ